MVFLLLLIYPVVWSLLFIGALLSASAITGHFDWSAGVGKDLPMMLLFILGPTALLMGLLGCLHLLILCFTKDAHKNSPVFWSVKVGGGIGTFATIFAVTQIIIVPDMMNRVWMFGLPAFFTAIISGYLIGIKYQTVFHTMPEDGT